MLVLISAIRSNREIHIGSFSIGSSNKSDKKSDNNQLINSDNKVTWDIVDQQVPKIKDALISDQYFPTLIVGIGRGGSVVGALLSGCLGSVPIIVLDRVYKWSTEGRTDDILFKNIDFSSFNQKVLIVAGELHSGNTVKMYKKYFEECGAGEIRVYSFMKEKYPFVKPDYYSIESEKADIILPWMITKDYKRQSLK